MNVGDFVNYVSSGQAFTGYITDVGYDQGLPVAIKTMWLKDEWTREPVSVIIDRHTLFSGYSLGRAAAAVQPRSVGAD